MRVLAKGMVVLVAFAVLGVTVAETFVAPSPAWARKGDDDDWHEGRGHKGHKHWHKHKDHDDDWKHERHGWRGDRGGPPPHAPAWGYRAKRQYRFYPGAKVYYDPGRRVWFYREVIEDRHVWRSAPRLPGWVVVREKYVVVDGYDDPYDDFEIHLKIRR